LYRLFVIEHGRRRIPHFNVTRHSSPDWVVQQLSETFAEAAACRYAALHHDSTFNAKVIAFLDTQLTRDACGQPFRYWLKALQEPTFDDALGRVEPEDSGGYFAHQRKRLNDGTVDFEVLVPDVSARIKESNWAVEPFTDAMSVPLYRLHRTRA
jgi:hypothetical protein